VSGAGGRLQVTGYRVQEGRSHVNRSRGGKGVRGEERVSGKGRKGCQERVKKLTISRRDAEAQRFELNNCFIFFVDSAPLRLCAR
jgi:hypothetical protein